MVGTGATPIEPGSLLFGENAFSDGEASLELELGDGEVGEIHPVEWKTASSQKAVSPLQQNTFPTIELSSTHKKSEF
jgi:hypothetical protein